MRFCFNKAVTNKVLIGDFDRLSASGIDSGLSDEGTLLGQVPKPSAVSNRRKGDVLEFQKKGKFFL